MPTPETPESRPIEIPVNDRKGKVIAFVRVIEIKEDESKALLQLLHVRPDGQESLQFSKVIER